MKKLLFILLAFPTICFSQSIDDLDTKNGYKDITFDMPADSVIKALNIKNMWGNLGKTDHYIMLSLTKKEYRVFSDFKCDNIWFVVLRDQNKIADIYLSMTESGAYDYQKVVLFFTSLYGTPTTVDKIYNNVEWKGNKVRLTVEYETYPEKLTVKIVNREAEEIVNQTMSDKFEKDKKDF